MQYIDNILLTEEIPYVALKASYAVNFCSV